jgi:hypothetical protein
MPNWMKEMILDAKPTAVNGSAMLAKSSRVEELHATEAASTSNINQKAHPLPSAGYSGTVEAWSTYRYCVPPVFPMSRASEAPVYVPEDKSYHRPRYSKVTG